MASYVDREGNDIDLYLWAWLLEDNSYRVVARHIFYDVNGFGRELLTVWLGLVKPTSVIFDDRSELFGTGFGDFGHGGWKEIATYQTESDALAGHAHYAAVLAKAGQLTPLH